MTWLELKIPPPVVALLCAIGMVYLPDLFGLQAFEVPFQDWVAGLVILFGLSFDLLGLIEFRRHATTISPLSPNKSSQVVSSGVYRLSRNPMYLGLAIVLRRICGLQIEGQAMDLGDGAATPIWLDLDMLTIHTKD
jgi:protein-S-isoprenylcysteine O-methyltransferase Ste14